MNKKLLIVVNDSAFFVSHWLSIALNAKKNGFNVFVVSGDSVNADLIKRKGFHFRSFTMSRSGVNPFLEVRSIYFLFKLIKTINPDVLHLITIKPNIYGGLISKFLNIKSVIIAVTGMGYVFTETEGRKGVLKTLLSFLYGFVINQKGAIVLLENEDDRDSLVQAGLVRRSSSIVVDGAGVDLDQYSFSSEPAGQLSVLLAARLLKDKGVEEFYAAAQIFKDKGSDVVFSIAGTIDEGNPASITSRDFDCWRKDSVVKMLGYRSDMELVISNSHIVVLPSYREGLPKVLLEAAACGRPVITTDVPGCRQAIIPGETGLLVGVRDVGALVDAIDELVCNIDLRRRMGESGRRLAEERFSSDVIASVYLKLYSGRLSGF